MTIRQLLDELTALRRTLERAVRKLEHIRNQIHAAVQYASPEPPNEALQRKLPKKPPSER